MNLGVRVTAVALGLALTLAVGLVDRAGAQNAAAQNPGPSSKSSEPASLSREAALLQEEAARVDGCMKAFKLHGAVYKRSPLHKSVQPESAKRPASKSGGKRSQKQRKTKVLQKLHSEYEGHVAQLREMVDQYKHLYQGYAAHYEQYKVALEQHHLRAEQAETALTRSDPILQGTITGQRLLASERQLASVFQKMYAMDESVDLPESVLCPAFQDLRHELVQAIADIRNYTQMLPVSEQAVVTENQNEQVTVLQNELAQADALYKEQVSLQTEFAQLQKRFQMVNQKHIDLNDSAPAATSN